ncbi:MAG: ImmA/IrrE family metallo-endopeptidase [Planctomycetes bacterium]|nr:ImmA/IrrE family metallo-endopeptidase [Planctomycetota bacterium]
MTSRAYRRKVRILAENYLRLLGLSHWRLTRLYVGIPKHIKQELAAHYPDAANGFYACVYPTGRNKFVMAVSKDVPSHKLDSVIAHEISHILLHHLYEATRDGRQTAAKNQLELVCDRIASAVIRSRCA